MLKYDLDKMLYVIPADKHSPEAVSYTHLDMTDMKIQALVRIHAVMKVILQKKRKQRYAGKSQLSRKCIKC